MHAGNRNQFAQSMRLRIPCRHLCGRFLLQPVNVVWIALPIIKRGGFRPGQGYCEVFACSTRTTAPLPSTRFVGPQRIRDRKHSHKTFFWGKPRWAPLSVNIRCPFSPPSLPAAVYARPNRIDRSLAVPFWYGARRGPRAPMPRGVCDGLRLPCGAALGHWPLLDSNRMGAHTAMCAGRAPVLLSILLLLLLFTSTTEGGEMFMRLGVCVFSAPRRLFSDSCFGTLSSGLLGAYPRKSHLFKKEVLDVSLIFQMFWDSSFGAPEDGLAVDVAESQGRFRFHSRNSTRRCCPSSRNARSVKVASCVQDVTPSLFGCV